MQCSTNHIQRLPQHVIDRSRSDSQITDLPTALIKLAQNSLQAGSKTIHVVVNVAEGSLAVEDDGLGVSARSMQLVGQRFCTSSPTRRGESLSCLAQVSVLQITSRAAGTFETCTKTISPQQATQTSTSSCHVTLCTIPRQRSGTTVILSRFLHNQPIRRKQAKPHAATLADLKTALHALLLPHTAVELVLKQEGNSSYLLHLPKGRSLPDSLQQYFSQHGEHLQILSAPHRQGWQLQGAAVAPPATFNSSQQQLLYINSHPVTCPALTLLLKDWYLKALRTLQASADNSSGTRMSAKTPEPGYVLLLTCPAAAVTVIGCVAGKQEVDLSSSIEQLYPILQEGLGPAWGSMPSAWTALAKSSRRSKRLGTNSNQAATTETAVSTGAKEQQQLGSSTGRSSTQLVLQQRQQDQLEQQDMMLPVRGLQMASKTRSLAGMQARQIAAGFDSTAVKLAHTQPQHTAASAQHVAVINDLDDLELMLEDMTHEAATLHSDFNCTGGAATGPHGNGSGGRSSLAHRPPGTAAALDAATDFRSSSGGGSAALLVNGARQYNRSVGGGSGSSRGHKMSLAAAAAGGGSGGGGWRAAQSNLATVKLHGGSGGHHGGSGGGRARSPRAAAAADGSGRSQRAAAGGSGSGRQRATAAAAGGSGSLRPCRDEHFRGSGKGLLGCWDSAWLNDNDDDNNENTHTEYERLDSNGFESARFGVQGGVIDMPLDGQQPWNSLQMMSAYGADEFTQAVRSVSCKSTIANTQQGGLTAAAAGTVLDERGGKAATADMFGVSPLAPRISKQQQFQEAKLHQTMISSRMSTPDFMPADKEPAVDRTALDYPSTSCFSFEHLQHRDHLQARHHPPRQQSNSSDPFNSSPLHSRISQQFAAQAAQEQQQQQTFVPVTATPCHAGHLLGSGSPELDLTPLGTDRASLHQQQHSKQQRHGSPLHPVDLIDLDPDATDDLSGLGTVTHPYANSIAPYESGSEPAPHDGTAFESSPAKVLTWRDATVAAYNGSNWETQQQQQQQQQQQEQRQIWEGYSRLDAVEAEAADFQIGRSTAASQLLGSTVGGAAIAGAAADDIDQLLFDSSTVDLVSPVPVGHWRSHGAAITGGSMTQCYTININQYHRQQSIDERCCGAADHHELRSQPQTSAWLDNNDDHDDHLLTQLPAWEQLQATAEPQAEVHWQQEPSYSFASNPMTDSRSENAHQATTAAAAAAAVVWLQAKQQLCERHLSSSGLAGAVTAVQSQSIQSLKDSFGALQGLAGDQLQGSAVAVAVGQEDISAAAAGKELGLFPTYSPSAAAAEAASDIDMIDVAGGLPPNVIVPIEGTTQRDDLACQAVVVEIAASEETVQQDGLGDQQAESLPLGAPAAAAAAATAADTKDNSETDVQSPITPLRQLPPVFLQPMQQRLLQSAPPEVKQRRRFAQSDCSSSSNGRISGVRASSIAIRNSGSSSRARKRLELEDEEAPYQVDSAVAVHAQPNVQRNVDRSSRSEAVVSSAARCAVSGTGVDKCEVPSRRRRRTCPAAVAAEEKVQQQPQSVLIPSQPGASGRLLAARDMQQLQGRSAGVVDTGKPQQGPNFSRRTPLAPISSNIATAAQQQQQQVVGCSAADVLQQLKLHSKQSKLPFKPLTGSKPAKASSTKAPLAAVAAAAADMPWWKKKKQNVQLKKAAVKSAAAVGGGRGLKGTAEAEAPQTTATTATAAAGQVAAGQAAAGQAAAAAVTARQTPAVAVVVNKVNKPSALKRAATTQHLLQDGQAGPSAAAAAAGAVSGRKSCKRVRFSDVPVGQDTSRPHNTDLGEPVMGDLGTPHVFESNQHAASEQHADAETEPHYWLAAVAATDSVVSGSKLAAVVQQQPVAGRAMDSSPAALARSSAAGAAKGGNSTGSAAAAAAAAAGGVLMSETQVKVSVVETALKGEDVDHQGLATPIRDSGSSMQDAVAPAAAAAAAASAADDPVAIIPRKIKQLAAAPPPPDADNTVTVSPELNSAKPSAAAAAATADHHDDRVSAPVLSSIKPNAAAAADTDNVRATPDPSCTDPAAAAAATAGHHHDKVSKTAAPVFSSVKPGSAFLGAGEPAILSIAELELQAAAKGKVIHRQQRCLVPGSVTRQQLQQAQTLAQVANKVIVVRCGSILLAVDQHAADERVQLELLQQQLAKQLQLQQQSATATTAVVTGNNPSDGASYFGGPKLLLERQLLQPAQQLQLSMSEAGAVSSYQQQIEFWGWKLQLVDSHSSSSVRGSSSSSSTGGVAVSSGVVTAAVLQQVPVLAGVQLGALDLKLYLHQLLDTAGSTSQPPPGVIRKLKSKACRSAIMFGDELTEQQAVEVVHQLGQTQLCFCCAHGRPTTAPLLDMAALNHHLQQQAAAKSLGQLGAAAAAAGGFRRAGPQKATQELAAALRRRLTGRPIPTHQ